MASVVVVVAGATLALAVPLAALKEAIEKRTKENFNKHLSRRSSCKVNFGSMKNDQMVKTAKESKGYESDSSAISEPPGYNDICHQTPPAYKSIR